MDNSLELLIEVRQVVESAFVTDTCHRHLLFGKQFTGMSDLEFSHEFDEGFLGMLLEIAAKGRRAHVHMFGYVIESDGLVQISDDVFLYLVEPVEIEGLGHVGIPDAGMIPKFIGRSHHVQQDIKLDDPLDTRQSKDLLHLLVQFFSCMTQELNTPDGLVQQLPDVCHLRHVFEIGFEDVSSELDDQRLGIDGIGMIDVDRIALPPVWRVFPNDADLPFRKPADAVTDVGGPCTFNDQKDLDFRMEMPGNHKVGNFLIQENDGMLRCWCKFLIKRLERLARFDVFFRHTNIYVYSDPCYFCNYTT